MSKDIYGNETNELVEVWLDMCKAFDELVYTIFKPLIDFINIIRG